MTYNIFVNNQEQKQQPLQSFQIGETKQWQQRWGWRLGGLQLSLHSNDRFYLVCICRGGVVRCRYVGYLSLPKPLLDIPVENQQENTIFRGKCHPNVTFRCIIITTKSNQNIPPPPLSKVSIMKQVLNGYRSLPYTVIIKKYFF